jgi:hypothetical protein
MTRQNIREAGGSSIDKVDTQLSKALSAVQKAQSAILDAADAFDDVMVEAIACGGKVAEIVPAHIKMHIANLTKVADTDLGGIVEGGQSSVTALKDLIGNIPYKDLRQPSSEDRRAQIAAQPNISQGPQSAISEDLTLEEFYRSKLNEDVNAMEYRGSALSFNNLREAGIFGSKLDGDMMGSLKMSPGVIEKVPLQNRQRIRERMQAAAEDQIFEGSDFEDRSNERLQEGSFFNGSLRAFGGADGQPMNINLGGLSEAGSFNMVDKT